MHQLKTLLKGIHVMEDSLLALMLAAMILFAAADIVARNVLGGGIAWVPPLLRVMVLWLGLQGALLATRSNQHISVDILARLLKPSLTRWASSISALFACVVCALVAWHSTEFVVGSFEYQDEAFSGWLAWPLQSIIPLSFLLMALRFMIHACGYAVSIDYDPEKAKSDYEKQHAGPGAQ